MGEGPWLYCDAVVIPPPLILPLRGLTRVGEIASSYENVLANMNIAIPKRTEEKGGAGLPPPHQITRSPSEKASSE